MRREELIEEIKKQYYNKRREIKSWGKENSDELKQCKNGVYTFFDAENKPLYVGMVSNAKTASLYARLHANGNAKHSIKEWYRDIAKIYFLKIKTKNKFHIMILERILIQELKPIHNDLNYSEKELEKLYSLIKK